MAQNASDHSPLYFKVMELIRKDILDKLNPGEKIPTEFELIERYKASRITVRRALDELTLEGEIFRLHGKGTFKTRQTKVKNIVYVIYDISMLTSPGRIETIQEIAQVAEKNGYHLVIRSFNTKHSLSNNFSEFAFSEKNSGYIVSVQELDNDDVENFQKLNLPCVFIHQDANYSVRFSFDKAGKLCQQYIQKHNYKNVLLLMAPLTLPDSKEYLTSLQKHLSSCATLKVCETNFNRQEAAIAYKEFLANNNDFFPEVVICGDDTIASGVHDQIAAMNIDNKVKIIGFNNSILAKELSFSSLTTQEDKQSKKAAELLVDIMENRAPKAPYKVLIEPTFIER